MIDSLSNFTIKKKISMMKSIVKFSREKNSIMNKETQQETEKRTSEHFSKCIHSKKELISVSPKVFKNKVKI